LLLAGTVAFPSRATASLKEVGDVLQFAVPAYAFGYSLLEKDYDGTKQFLYTLGSSQLTVHVLKMAVDEKRPNYTKGDRKNSFPSGHTSSAFAGAAFMHRRYGFKSAIVPYGLAIITGYSRVDAKKHHPHDVIVGALISCACAWIFTDERNGIVVSSDENMSTKVAYEVSF
jgi:membrane-associated phospholipid phosphatase